MTRRWTLILLAVAMVIGVTLTAAAKDYPPVVQDLLEKTKQQITEVTPEQVKAVVDKGEGTIILDVREPGEYQGGHLPGAISIPRGVLEFKIWDHMSDTSTPIYVYCKTGGRSALAAASLQELGFTDVASMAGGYLAWVEAGYPVER